jgi:hypothetical protein
MRIVVSVQAKKASSRGLVHYVAHSKIDAAREPNTREIFNSYADSITVEKANLFLKSSAPAGGAARPSNEDLHHLVISLRAEDYDRLGADEKERQESLKKITRETMKQLEKSVGADKLNWAAGIHRNTDNPHIHVAVQKEYFDQNFEKKSFDKIPARCLPHYEKSENEKRLAPGSLIESATEKLGAIISEKEKKQTRARENSGEGARENQSAEKTKQNEPNRSDSAALSKPKPRTEIENERDVLARALLAKFHLEKTQENLESLENQGHLRRFKITDAITGQKRRMSLYDLERRAEKEANRQIKKLSIADAAKKDELRKKLVGAELQQNSDSTKRIRTILHNLIVKENQELRRREKEYEKLKPAAEKIRQDCRRENKKLPVPNLSPDELEMLQARSLEKKDIRAAGYYEKVRLELARERGTPTRSDEEIRRLKALRILAELKTQCQEKQLKDLGDRKRTIPVEIGGEKWSLARADALIEKRQTDERKIVGKIGKVLDKIGLIEQKTGGAKLVEIKNEIAAMLSEKAEHLANELQLEKNVSKLLNEFYKNDTNPEKETLKPKFSAAELAEVESLAFELKNAEIYRENWQQQKEFIERAGAGGDKLKNSAEAHPESKQNTIAARAVAREIMCEAEVARAKEELALFQKNKNFQKFEVVNEKTNEAKFVCLKEVEFDSRGSLLDQTLEYFIENRDKRRTRHRIEKQVKEKTIELKENLKAAQSLFKVASAETIDYKQKSFFGTVKYLHAPVFTPKELITLEIRIKQTENKSEAANLQKILASTDYSKAENLSAILGRFSVENKFSQTAELQQSQQTAKEQTEDKNAAQTAARNEARAQTNRNAIRENKPLVEGDAARENKAENYYQDRGR